MPSTWLVRPPRTASVMVSCTTRGPMPFRYDASPGSRGLSSWRTYTVGIADIIPRHAFLWARHSAVASTRPLHSKMLPSWCAPAKHASSTPSKFTSLRRAFGLSCSHGRSRSGGWISWVHSLEGQEATATSTSPLTNSPSGRKWKLPAPSRPGQQSSLTRSS